MNSPSSAAPDSPSGSPAVAAAPETRPLYWSVRRELWENRSLYIAPLIVAGVMLLGLLIAALNSHTRIQAMSSLTQAQVHGKVTVPYSIIAFLLIVTSWIIGAFYSLDALHGERRDRSILFWKSLPVSDRVTVVSKASIPLVVLPVIIFPIIVGTQLLMLLMGTVVLLASGVDTAILWGQLSVPRMSLALLYALAVIALWHAPIYGWLLVVSAWARRATFLWASLPLLAIGIFEKIAFNTSHFGALLKYRLMGWFTEAFDVNAPGSVPTDPLTHLTPVKFLSTPGLWAGLAVAAGLFALAVWLRRYREPM